VHEKIILEPLVLKQDRWSLQVVNLKFSATHWKAEHVDNLYLLKNNLKMRPSTIWRKLCLYRKHAYMFQHIPLRGREKEKGKTFFFFTEKVILSTFFCWDKFFCLAKDLFLIESYWKSYCRSYGFTLAASHKYKH